MKHTEFIYNKLCLKNYKFTKTYKMKIEININRKKIDVKITDHSNVDPFQIENIDWHLREFIKQISPNKKEIKK